MTRSTMLRAACAVAAVLATTAGAGFAQGTTKIVLNSQANEAGFPLWLAGELGYYEENGLEAEIRYFANGGAALASGAAGDWQAGWTGSPPAITGWAKFGLIPVGTMMKEDRNLKLIMRADALEGSSPAEVLKTKRIGTVPNSTWSQVLYACAEHFGVDGGDLDIVPLDPPVTRQALQSGEISAGMTDSSPDIDLVQDTENFEVVCDGAIAGTSVIDPYIVTPKFAEENPDAAAGFVNAAFQANEYIVENPDKAVDYLLQYYQSVGIDGSEEKARYTLGYRDFQTLDQALADMKDGTTENTLRATAQVFVAGGSYDEVPDLDNAIKAGLPILEAAKALRQ